MPAGRVLGVYKKRLAAAVSSTVVGDGSVRVIPVDSDVVDFDEEGGGQFVHVATGDVYDYESTDHDLETITLSAGLPIGKTLSANDTLHVINPDGRRAFDYVADIAVDDVANDVVSAAVPEEIQQSLLEGARKQGDGPLVQADAEGEEWQVQRLVGEEAPGGLVPGDSKWTFRSVAGGGVLHDGGWLKCDGTAVSRSVYAALFNAIGTMFGAGNGTTTFNLPDMRGRTSFGTGTQITLGATDGLAEANRGPKHTHNMFHNHPINAVSHAGVQNTQTTAGGQNRVTAIAGNFDGQHDHGGNTLAPSNSDTADSGLTPIGYMGMHCLIKT